ncbi:predicted protein [Sclerotinia sclerotiorum 1980 UF-70]|uniref:Uncharacterized protein n=1 Tax=Sclerotinia sclerotiorum (strain ATCC 18683 / 1980 / Ss-1) TaxID=665079 RepID=A7E7X0_SCLS1|nr:predicted protein [Sclerotinia sclerotiorum 1980 UF-70]EDN96472.1 predicted protein [Sclerotinia sclerotiorum 1980 UF-70]
MSFGLFNVWGISDYECISQKPSLIIKIMLGGKMMVIPGPGGTFSTYVVSSLCLFTGDETRLGNGGQRGGYQEKEKGDEGENAPSERVGMKDQPKKEEARKIIYIEVACYVVTSTTYPSYHIHALE